MAEELLDTGVNCGTGFAKPLLQHALNLLNNQGKGGWPDLVVDGIYGPATLNALKTYMVKCGKDDEKVLVRVLNIIQGQRYIEICERNPTQEQFFYGWIKIELHNKVVHHRKRSWSSLIVSILVLCLMSGCSAHTINSNVNVGICVKAL
ncbi:putative peptidoglycan-binding domain-containing protein [Acinetobacter junii]|uniref:putative peptidoglycan-binding domain-containing protein n=1 Tax=Acinetobacter junii TaxID=40215 RepID=UPI0026B96DE8